MLRLTLAIALLSWPTLAAEPLKIAVLHPLLGDLVRQIGGDRVEMIDLIGPNGDPHHFEPSPANLGKAAGAKIYLAAGMGLEGYLPKVKAILADQATLIEVGATLPPLHGSHDCEEHEHPRDHAHEVDPHWWHSIGLFRRAVGIVTEAMANAAPENAAFFTQNSANYRSRLDELEKWTRREIAKIPRDQRHLATAHAAFHYFCKDWGFTPHPVQGLSREQMPAPKALAELVAALKANQVTAIFPEKESNPKILTTLTKDTGIRLGEPLIADGTGGTGYLEMMRHNVNAIVKGLEK